MPTVMVVDDDDDIREALRRCLSSEGFDVLLCPDGADAIGSLESGCSPQVIVLDLLMPKMSGREVLAALRADPRWSSIPVVVISGNRGDSAEQLGVRAVLRKPFELPDLLVALRSACAPSRPPLRAADV